MPPEPTQTTMSRFERLQMNWALKPEAQREKLRAKYDLKPSKLGGKLAEVRRRRLDEAGPMDRVKLIGRSVKSDVKRTARHAKRDIKQGVRRAANQMSKEWATAKKNIRDKIAVAKYNFRNRGNQQPIQQPSVQPGPRLPEHHAPQRTIPDLQRLEKTKDMWKKGASEINAEFKNGELSFTSKKRSWGAFKARWNNIWNKPKPGQPDQPNKDAATIEKNAKSIKAVLDHIESRSSPEVRKLVENTYIALDGDKKDGPKMTVKDRMERGTFLSSKFIYQLHEATIAAQKAIMSQHNQQAVDHFLSNQPSTALDELHPNYATGFSGAADSPKDEACQKSGLSRWLDDVIAKGGLPGKPVKEFPETYKLLKRAIDEETQKAPGEVGLDSEHAKRLFVGLHNRLIKLQKQCNNNKRSDNTERPLQITEQHLHEAATAHFGNTLLWQGMVKAANEAITRRYTYRHSELPKYLATAIRGYVDANDAETTRGITQSDCDWLADQVENNDYLDLPEPSLIGRMTGSYDENREMDSIILKLRQEIEDGVKEIAPKERENFNKVKDKIHSSKEVRQEIIKVRKAAEEIEEYTPKTFSKLLGPTLKNIIQERNRRLDKINRKQAAFRKESEAKLANNLEKFPDLQSAAQDVKRGAYRGLNKGVSSAGEFFKTVLEQDLNQKIPMSDSLEALDKFATLQDRLTEIGKQGGLDQADPATLEEIQQTAQELSEQAPMLRSVGRSVEKATPDDIEELVESGDQLESVPKEDPKPDGKSQRRAKAPVEDPNAQLEAIGKAIQSAAGTIEDEVSPYLNIASQVANHKADRLLRQIPQVHQQHNIQANNAKNQLVNDLDSSLDPNSNDGKRPSQVVGSDFDKAFKTTGMVSWKNKSRFGANPMKAYQEFSNNHLSTLDEFAEFGLKHESNTRLMRRGETEQLSENEQQQLKSFQQVCDQLANKVKKFERDFTKLKSTLANAEPPKGNVGNAKNATGSTGNLGNQQLEDRLDKGIPGDVQELLDGLDQTVEHMKKSLESQEFIGTNSKSPDPLLDQGVLARPWTEMSRKLENTDKIASALNDKTYLDMNVEYAIEDFKDFNEALTANMDKHPIVSQDRLAINDLGKLDVLAGYAEEGRQKIEQAIGKLDELEEKILERDDGNQPKVAGKWDTFADQDTLPSGATKHKEAYLDNIRSLRDDLKAQHAHMTNRLRDFKIYRGSESPDAATSAALTDVGRGVKNWSWSKDSGNMITALQTGLQKNADIHSANADQNASQAINEAKQALKPGLHALGRMMRAGDPTTDPALGGPYRPSDEQLGRMRETQEQYEKSLAELEKLDQHATKMSELMTSLAENMGDLPDLEQVAGGTDWLRFAGMIQEAVEKAKAHKARLDNAINRAEQRPEPMSRIPNKERLATRAQSVRQAISEQGGLSQTLNIDKNLLPEEPVGWIRNTEKQTDPTLPHGAINAFLGAPVVSREQVQTFQKVWAKTTQGPNEIQDENGGTPAELPWAYLNYLNESGQSPHKVQFQAFDPNDEKAADGIAAQFMPKTPGDRYLIGTQDPPGFKAFHKDSQGQWQMFDPIDPSMQRRMDPWNYVEQYGMVPFNKNQMMTIVSVAADSD